MITAIHCLRTWAGSTSRRSPHCPRRSTTTWCARWVGLRRSNVWENHGKTMGKPWENQGKPCITRQKSWGSSSCFLHFPGICLWKLHNIDIYWGYTNGYAVILISFAVKHVLDSAGIIPLFRQCLKQNMNPPATQRPYQLHASTNIQMPICVW